MFMSSFCVRLFKHLFSKTVWWCMEKEYLYPQTWSLSVLAHCTYSEASLQFQWCFLMVLRLYCHAKRPCTFISLSRCLCLPLTFANVFLPKRRLFLLSHLSAGLGKQWHHWLSLSVLVFRSAIFQQQRERAQLQRVYSSSFNYSMLPGSQLSNLGEMSWIDLLKYFYTFSHPILLSSP